MKFSFSYAGIYGIHERSMEMIGTWLGGLRGGEGLAPSWLVWLKTDRVDRRERTGRHRGFSEKLLRVLMYFNDLEDVLIERFGSLQNRLASVSLTDEIM